MSTKSYVFIMRIHCGTSRRFNVRKIHHCRHIVRYFFTGALPRYSRFIVTFPSPFTSEQ